MCGNGSSRQTVADDAQHIAACTRPFLQCLATALRQLPAQVGTTDVAGTIGRGVISWVDPVAMVGQIPGRIQCGQTPCRDTGSPAFGRPVQTPANRCQAARTGCQRSTFPPARRVGCPRLFVRRAAKWFRRAGRIFSPAGRRVFAKQTCLPPCRPCASRKMI